MILESIIGIDSVNVDDVIICKIYAGPNYENTTYHYKVTRINKDYGTIRITQVRSGKDYGDYHISTFHNKEYGLLKSYMPYDPTQQGDTSDDI